MGDAVPKVEGLNCTNCGAPLQVRTFGQAVTIVCGNCGSILDARDPRHQVLQRFQARTGIQPLIPLGTRGKLRDTEYEAIGFQVRSTWIEGQEYSWREYVLFNPYKGFRYLTEYDGHWNDVSTVKAVPSTGGFGHPHAELLGRRYRLFQTATAQTTYVLGEFPWQVRVGEAAEVRDYINPPQMLSAETTGNETVWSLGEYLPGRRVWEIFKLKGAPPAPQGIYANQPRPTFALKEMWVAFLILVCCLAVLAGAFDVFSRKQELFRRTYSFGSEAAFVTDMFELTGANGNIEVATRTRPNVDAYFQYALINDGTGQAWNFGRELSDGRDSAVIASLPPGRYYLRVEPETESPQPGVEYEIRVRRDVPVVEFYVIAMVLLVIPPAFQTFRAVSFESRRWKESDYAS